MPNEISSNGVDLDASSASMGLNIDANNLTSRDVTLLNRLMRRPDWQIPAELFFRLPVILGRIVQNQKRVDGDLIDGGYSVRAQQNAAKLIRSMHNQNIRSDNVNSTAHRHLHLHGEILKEPQTSQPGTSGSIAKPACLEENVGEEELAETFQRFQIEWKIIRWLFAIFQVNAIKQLCEFIPLFPNRLSRWQPIGKILVVMTDHFTFD